MINLAIVDDNTEFINSLTRYLQQIKYINIIATATDKEQALKLPLEYNIDIMLMDVNLSENNCDGILIVNQILTMNFPHQPQIIMVTDYNDNEIVQKSFLAGAVCYTLKTNFRLLPNIIQSVHNSSLPEMSILKEYSELYKEKILKTKYLLSEMEFKIYGMAEIGKRRSEILESLFIAESTYKKHVNNILKKFKVKNLRMAFEDFRKKIYVRKVNRKEKSSIKIDLF